MSASIEGEIGRDARPVCNHLRNNVDLDLSTSQVLTRRTGNPVNTAFPSAEQVAPILWMFDIIAGELGKFALQGLVKAHLSPMVSSLNFGKVAVDVACEFIAQNTPMHLITDAQYGAAAPANLAHHVICLTTLDERHVLGGRAYVCRHGTRLLLSETCGWRRSAHPVGERQARCLGPGPRNCAPAVAGHHQAYLTSKQEADIRAWFLSLL